MSRCEPPPVSPQAYVDLPGFTPEGIATYLGSVAAYLFLVEWGIYWVRAGRACVHVGRAAAGTCNLRVAHAH